MKVEMDEVGGAAEMVVVRHGSSPALRVILTPFLPVYHYKLILPRPASTIWELWPLYLGIPLCHHSIEQLQNTASRVNSDSPAVREQCFPCLRCCKIYIADDLGACAPVPLETIRVTQLGICPRMIRY